MCCILNVWVDFQGTLNSTSGKGWDSIPRNDPHLSSSEIHFKWKPRRNQCVGTDGSKRFPAGGCKLELVFYSSLCTVVLVFQTKRNHRFTGTFGDSCLSHDVGGSAVNPLLSRCFPFLSPSPHRLPTPRLQEYPGR